MYKSSSSSLRVRGIVIRDIVSVSCFLPGWFSFLDDLALGTTDIIGVSESVDGSEECVTDGAFRMVGLISLYLAFFRLGDST